MVKYIKLLTKSAANYLKEDERMRKYILIGMGGFFGAILRFAVKNNHILTDRGSFPFNILIINVTGSFLLAGILSVTFRAQRVKTDVKFGIAIGFLGAFTTFSTLCKDTVNLITNGNYDLALLYLLMSAILGLAAVYLGTVLARKLQTIKSKQPDDMCITDTFENIKDEVK